MLSSAPITGVSSSVQWPSGLQTRSIRCSLGKVNDASPSSAAGAEPPVSWAAATASAGGDDPATPSFERCLGFPAGDLIDLIPLPDDLEALNGLVADVEAPFPGAFVPVVVHDTGAAERSYDAAEWAADLIRSAGGDVLAVAPYAEPDWDGQRLNARQWNHAAAMIERLDGVCQRFRLRIVINETLGDIDLSEGNGIDPDRPVRHLLDTGNFVADGFAPVQLISPERVAVTGGLVERFKGLLGDRT